MSDWKLVLETSGRVGQVGLAHGRDPVHTSALDATRRHARDLTATIGELLDREHLKVRDLSSILVSVGPGGYTGLRVGLATAKVLAYAANVPLVAVPTFPAVAAQAPPDAERLWVIGDALRGTIYLQRFERGRAIDELRLAPASDWLPWANREVWLTGPGVAILSDRLPCDARLVPAPDREPRIDGILAASEGLPPLTREELFRIEPLYLRASSAEEKAKSDRSPMPS